MSPTIAVAPSPIGYEPNSKVTDFFNALPKTSLQILHLLVIPVSDKKYFCSR